MALIDKENTNPKKNPWTTVTGTLFIVLSFIMYVVKYLVPLFFTLKEVVSYSDYIPVSKTVKMLKSALVSLNHAVEDLNKNNAVQSKIIKIIARKTVVEIGE